MCWRRRSPMPRSSESVAALASALAKAQAELINPEKSLTATIRPVRMVAVNDFSGLMSSAWALAKAEASAATDSLDRGMGDLRLQHIEGHRPRFRTLCFHAMPDGLLGVLGYQGLELAFRPF